jgi:hypothetical protein
MLEQVQNQSVPITALPDEIFGKSSGSESFADIMAQLNASQTNMVVDCDLETWSEPDKSRMMPPARQRHATKSHSSGAGVIHPRPFGHGKSGGAVGSFFGMPSTLKHRDLSPWQQEQAVTPERSWPTSTMTNVHKGAMLMSSSSPTLMSRTLHPAYGGTEFTASRSQFRTQLRHPARHADIDDEEMILTPVSHPATPPQRRRDSMHEEEILTPVQRVACKPHLSQCQFSSICRKSPNMNGLKQESDREEQDASKQKLLKLQARRRQLANELLRTELRLREAKESSNCSAGDDASVRSCAGPGGGGGALMRQRVMPSAGGPFAGKRTNLKRAVADDEFKSLNRVASDSYRYLGPGSDGPLHPDIHPLWT